MIMVYSMLQELLSPFHSAISSHVDTIHRQTICWARNFSIWDQRDDRHLQDAKVGWLAARFFPQSSPEHLQIAADWLLFFCAIDDETEEFRERPLELALFLLRLRGILAGQPPVKGDKGLAFGLHDVSVRLERCAPKAWMNRFVSQVEDLFETYLWEAVNRVHGCCPSVDSYTKIREVTIGLRPLFEFLALPGSAAIAGDAWSHPLAKSMMTMVCNSVGWVNDIYTYEREMRSGEPHNLVLVIMKESGVDWSTALSRVIKMHNDAVAQFLRISTELASAGAAPPEVQQLARALPAFLRGHLDWAHETRRYGVTAAAPAQAIALTP